MAATTILFMTSPIETAPASQPSYRYVPASCEVNEIPAAIAQIEQAHGAKVIGFVTREMHADMGRIMDEFDKEGK